MHGRRRNPGMVLDELHPRLTGAEVKEESDGQHERADGEK